jgi:hypothetical protein
LPVEVVKKSSAALSSNERELDTSTTTCAPANTSASPSPVRVLTPELGDAAIASLPCSASLATSLEPMSPVPPTTTTFVTMGLLTGAPVQRLLDREHEPSLDRLDIGGEVLN